MNAFHEVRFPLEIALHGMGGPQRRTDIVVTGSGREERNARWAKSRRRYEAGYGVKTLAQIAQVTSFFEERRGRLVGFRWHDRADYQSCAPDAVVGPSDQTIGVGDGATTVFQLVKTYGALYAPYGRVVAKPVAGSVRVAVAAVELAASRFSVDTTTGLVTLAAAPAKGASVTAGFCFDVPVRFDTDFLEIDLPAFNAGEIAKIPLVEILP